MVSVGKMVSGMFDLGQGQPWRERFDAWWEGVELESDLHYLTSDFTLPDNDGDAEPGENGRALSEVEEKVEAIQQIWGKGFEAPGTHEFVFELIQSLNLGKNQEVLQLGAALGGTARALAEEYLVSVTALVTSIDMAQIAMAQTIEAGLDKKVRYAPFNASEMGLKPGKYQCIIARETLFTLENKDRLIEQIERALVPGGHFVLFEYCSPDTESSSDELAEWEQNEVMTPHLATSDQMSELLQKKNFAILTNEDVTESYYGLIIEGWMNSLRTIKKMKILGDLNQQFILHLMDEAERWGRRASLLKSGELRYIRAHAMKSLTMSG